MDYERLAEGNALLKILSLGKAVKENL